MTMDLSQLTEFYLSSINATFTGLDCIYEQHGGGLIRSRNCLPFVATWAYLQFLVGSDCKHTFFPVCRMSGHINTLVYFYLALVCLFRQKSVFLSWNSYPSVFYPKGKNTLLLLIFLVFCFVFFLRPVSHVSSVSGLTILDWPFNFF